MKEQRSHCYTTCDGRSRVALEETVHRSPFWFVLFLFFYLFIRKGRFPSHTLMKIFVIQGHTEDGTEQKCSTSEHRTIPSKRRVGFIHRTSRLTGHQIELVLRTRCTTFTQPRQPRVKTHFVTSGKVIFPIHPHPKFAFLAGLARPLTRFCGRQISLRFMMGFGTLPLTQRGNGQTVGDVSAAFHWLRYNNTKPHRQACRHAAATVTP